MTAITGLLLLIGIFGQGAIRDRARFTDAVQTLEAQIESIKTEAAATVNASDSSPGTDTGNIVFGILVSFVPGADEYSVKTLSHVDVDSVTNSEYEPRVESEQLISLRWGVEYESVCEDPGSSSNCDPAVNPSYAKPGCILYYRDVNDGQLKMSVLAGDVCTAAVGDSVAAAGGIAGAITLETAINNPTLIENFITLSGLRFTDGTRNAVLYADPARIGGSVEIQEL